MRKSIFLLTFLFSGLISFAQTGEVIDKIAAVVGDETILLSDIEGAAHQMNEGNRPNDEIRCAALEQLLLQQLLVNQGKIDSIEVNEALVEYQLQQRIDYYIQLLGSREKFEEYYGKSVSEIKEDFEDEVRAQVLANQTRQQITAEVSVTPGEIQDMFDEIPADSLPLMGEQVHFRKLVISPMITDTEKNATRQFLDSIRRKVMAGSSMTIQVSRWSEDPGSKQSGGCYPPQRYGTFVPQYEEAVRNTPIKGYSEVFETEYGFHFLYVKDKTGDGYEACHLLMSAQPKEQDLIESIARLDSLAAEIETGTIGFEEAVAQYSTDDDSKNQGGRVINPMSGGTAHNLDELVDPKLFLALNGLEPGQSSKPIELTRFDGTTEWAIVYLEKRIPAHKANLKDDYLIFKNRAQSVKEQEALNDWVQLSLTNTYIRIDEGYRDCDFVFDWNAYATSAASDK